MAAKNHDEEIGISIVKKALEDPMRQLVANCGVDAAVVVNEVATQDDPSYGFNAATEEYGDLLKMGIIDPTKVVRCALQNAASIAGLLITTEAMIAEIPKKEAPAAPGGDMGGMGGMM